MNDKEIISRLIEEAEAAGTTALTMVSYLSEPWKSRMESVHKSCKAVVSEARQHLESEENPRQAQTDWQKIVDDLDEFPGRVSSDAMGTLQSLAGPGPDEIRETLQILRKSAVELNWTPVLNAIIALSELETD